jgi:hypothetical protein
MNESIIVGLVVGAGVAAVGALVGHFLRLREMDRQWREGERKAKSERRRQLLERELAVITEFADLNAQLWDSITWWSPTGKLLDPAARAELGEDAFLMLCRANIAALSIGDKSLKDTVKSLVDLMERCNRLLDPGTGKPHVGEEDEYKNARMEMRLKAGETRRRARELLEEV